MGVNFDNTEIAFSAKTETDLKRARLLFKSFDFPILLSWGPSLAKIAVFIGLKGLIKNTIFKQFCGGENIKDCKNTIDSLDQSGIGTILDYSVEGEDDEGTFEKTKKEILGTIAASKNNDKIPFAVFKVTGIIPSKILEKKSVANDLSKKDNEVWEKGKQRFFEICNTAYEYKVRLFIDAEESWLQGAIDNLADEAMAKYNQESCLIYNTLQMYRYDRLAKLKLDFKNTTHYLGYKLVRGAYMEKERARANEFGYEDPIQVDKKSTDEDYNKAIEFCIENANRISICIGTHNEQSSALSVELMKKNKMDSSDKRVCFSQLLGMSDHISYNLSNSGYNVAKYVPFGPVLSVIPYLTRRAQENSGVAGQMSRELTLIEREIKRRKTN
ncbi:MAG: proline dehydrogenase family protein [Bacteroidia bacterium]